MAKVKITSVEPIGTHRALVHVHYADRPHAFEELDVPVYPKATAARGEDLRRRRVNAGMTLREFARRIGISPAAVSSVELGQAFVEEGQDEWDAALDDGGE